MLTILVIVGIALAALGLLTTSFILGDLITYRVNRDSTVATTRAEARKAAVGAAQVATGGLCLIILGGALIVISAVLS